MFAEAGHDVVCTDIDRERIAKLNAGGVPITSIISTRSSRPHTRRKNLFIPPTPAKPSALVTPSSSALARPKRFGEADLSAIDHVARQIAAEAKTPKLVVEKRCSVPARTALESRAALVSKKPVRTGQSIDFSTTSWAFLLRARFDGPRGQSRTVGFARIFLGACQRR